MSFLRTKSSSYEESVQHFSMKRDAPPYFLYVEGKHLYDQSERNDDI